MFVLSRFEIAKVIWVVVCLFCGMTAVTAQAKNTTSAKTTGPAKTKAHAPYSQVNSNALYNQLFCDNLVAYRQSVIRKNVLARTVLFLDSPDIVRLTRLTQSPSASSCQKLLAFHLLHKLHAALPQKTSLLGVVVEVAFDNGQDTLVAYKNGHVVYIHRNGKVQAIKKADTKLSGAIHKLFQESQILMEKTQPWPEQRLGPPDPGQVRISLLTSDGIHFGQGSMKRLELNPLAGPVLTAATELLIKLASK